MEIETLSETSDTKSTLACLITWEDLIVYCCCETFKSCIVQHRLCERNGRLRRENTNSTTEISGHCLWE